MSSVSINIDGTRFRFWSSVVIRKSIDGIDTVEFEGPFDPTDPNQREVFRPFTYKPVEVLVDDEPLFTGIMSRVVPRDTPEKTEFAVGAYATPGEMAELTVPGSEMPTQFRQQNLHEIAETICGYYDIGLVTPVEPGPRFKKVKLEPDQFVLGFLVDLARQRNQVISNTSTGELLFRRAISGGPNVAYLEQGAPPLRGVTPSFNPAEYYSEITGLMSVRPRSKSSVKFTVKNPYLTNVFRPHIYRIPDTEKGGVEQAVRSKLTRMYANAIAYTLEVSSWTDRDTGTMWEPNTVVRVLCPNAMIYEPYDFVVRSVEFRLDSKSETASLDVMVPGSFTESGEVARFPWDEPQ